MYQYEYKAMIMLRIYIIQESFKAINNKDDSRHCAQWKLL